MYMYIYSTYLESGELRQHLRNRCEQILIELQMCDGSQLRHLCWERLYRVAVNHQFDNIRHVPAGASSFCVRICTFGTSKASKLERQVPALSSSGVSICTFVLVKQVN
jgi:hypothetical protein